ncbi:MAG TPA: hypothetical protein VHG28_21225 [Longimicrobiaceae bacterium]|nr:hypothetical protein [Longimicrobiaceae bacterium]
MHLLRRPLLALLACAACLASGACALTEVTSADGEDVLVAEAVLRADRFEQRILLHRTLRGRTVAGEPGARVVVRSESGREVVFREASQSLCVEPSSGVLRGEDSLRVEATCYRSAPQEGRWVVPGRSYTLEIESQRGERLRGTTRVPGDFDLLGLSRAFRDPATGDRRCTLPPDTPLELTWSTSRGTWAYLTEMEIRGLPGALAGRGIRDIPDPLQLTGVSVSETDTTVLVPTEVGVFERFSYDQELLRAIQNGFPAGVQVRLVVAATDRNFVNSVRGGAFNPSGTVRISSVVGDGVGVFGSVYARTLLVDVFAQTGAFPCLGPGRQVPGKDPLQRPANRAGLFRRPRTPGLPPYMV